jgi:hypothetical protein
MTSRTLRRRCPFRVEQVQPGRFIVVERRTSNVVEAGFSSYEKAWSWIANRIEGRA